MNKKIISIDVDGTLTEFKKMQTTKKNIEAINSLSDEYIVVISTGLPLDFILSSFVSEINYDYLITDLGSIIYSKKLEKIIQKTAIKLNDMNLILKMITKFNLFFTNVNRTFYYWFESFDKDIKNYLELNHQSQFEKTDIKNFWNVFKDAGRINICGNRDDIIKIYNELINNKRLNLVLDPKTKSIININPKNTSKDIAFKFLIDRLNIKESNIFSIGDSDLDLKSFELSYKSYAPSTSSELVLKNADYITKRPNESSVAEAIDDIIHLWK